MTAVRVGTFPPGSPEWHAARAAGIGASEIAAVVGLSPWESAYGLWHRKAGLLGAPQQTDLMSAGNDFEDGIASRYRRWYPGLRVTRTGTWQSAERPWQRCNPDRLLPGRVPLQIKFSMRADGWGPSGSDLVPVYYRAQVLWEMDVLGADTGVLFGWIGGTYREYPIEADPEDMALLRDAGAAFWESLPRSDHPGTPPDLDTSDHTLRVLRELHPEIDDVEQEVPVALADAYRAARAALATVEDVDRLTRSMLLARMGRARRAVTPHGQRVAIRYPHRGGVALRETTPKATPTTIREAISA